MPLSPTARPVPEDFDVGEGPAVPERKAPEFDVGEGIHFTKPDYTGLSKDHYPLADARDGWTCPYGCPGTLAKIPDIQAHSWDCPYWWNEGKDKTPFELPAHGGGAANRSEPPMTIRRSTNVVV